MTTVVSSDGRLVGVGGDQQPFPRSSVPLANFGDNSSAVTLVGDRTVSYAHLYRTQLWVGIATNKMARQISRLPLKEYRRTSDGRERVRTGPFVQALKTPWAGGAPIDLKMAIALPLLVHGNAALRKVRRGKSGPLIGFAPLSWSRLRVIGDGTTIEGWETSQPGHPRFIGPEDVVHFAWRGLDGPVGISPLAQLAVTVAIEEAAQRYQLALMRNGARPPSALTADKEFLGLEPEERQALLGSLRADVNEIYAGPENAGRPAVLPPGLEWHMVGHSAVDAELINQRKLSREEVAAAYDVPPPLIGMLERSTFSNITELHSMFYVTVLGPWLTLIAEQMQAQAIDAEPTIGGDTYVEFDLSEVLKGDLLKRSQALALQIGWGVLTIDEAREIENRPTFGLPETSRPLYPSNNLTPAGYARLVEKPTSDPASTQVTEAAKAFAGMNDHDVRQLLAASGGSVVDTIFELAVASSDGSDPESEADEPAGDDVL